MFTKCFVLAVVALLLREQLRDAGHFAVDVETDDKDAMKADILAQLEKEEMDADALKQIADLHRARMDEFIDLGIDRLVEFHKTLTPEQKAKLVQKLEDCERWHRP